MSRRLSNCGAAQQRFRLSEHVVRICKGSKRQRLAKAEDCARLVEQAREQRRADVPGVENEMKRPLHPQPAAPPAWRQQPVIQAPSVEGLRMRSSRKLAAR
jgi:hypothetical protein